MRILSIALSIYIIGFILFPIIYYVWHYKIKKCKESDYHGLSLAYIFWPLVLIIKFAYIFKK
jgi:hypothetical protein